MSINISYAIVLGSYPNEPMGATVRIAPVHPNATTQGEIQVHLDKDDVPRSEWLKLEVSLKRLAEVTSVKLTPDDVNGRAHFVIKTNLGQLRGAKLEAAFNKVVRKVDNIVTHKVAVTV